MLVEVVTKSYCENLAQKVNSLQEYPVECKKFDDLYANLEKKFSQNKDPFLGMPSGSAIRARQSRKEGRESNEKLQRRLTTGVSGFTKK